MFPVGCESSAQEKVIGLRNRGASNPVGQFKGGQCPHAVSEKRIGSVTQNAGCVAQNGLDEIVHLSRRVFSYSGFPSGILDEDNLNVLVLPEFGHEMVEGCAGSSVWQANQPMGGSFFAEWADHACGELRRELGKPVAPDFGVDSALIR